MPWYADGLCFECTQCGNCCGGAPGYVWVTTTEITEIAAFQGQSRADFSARHVRQIGQRQSLLERDNGDCEFLARDAHGKALCTIYSVRPLQCRTWPFWSSNLESSRNWAVAGRGCPGIDKGPRHSLPVIQSALIANGRRPL